MYLTKSLLLWAGLLASSHGIAAELPREQPDALGMSGERLARIAPAMQRYIDAQLTPGVITAVMRHGKLVHFEAQGHMDVSAAKPMREDAIFRIASMTKPIASVALMMLWEEGHFQLRDPVSKFIPEFATTKVSTTADASGNQWRIGGPQAPNTNPRHAHPYRRLGE